MTSGAQVRLPALLLLSLVATSCAETAYRSMNDPDRDLWQRPQTVIQSLTRYLRPGGRIAIIDYTPTGWAWLFGHATAKETVREELAAAGYRLVQDFPILEKQHFQIFSVSAP